MNLRLRDLAKEVSLVALSATGIIRFSEFLARDTLRAVTYHRVIPRSKWNGAEHPANTLFADEFEAQMAYVAKRFHVLDRDELRAALAGTKKPKANSLVITFDDGYANNFSHALPVLQRYGLHAVFFVTANLIGDPGAAFWFDRLDRVLGAVDFERVRVALHGMGVDSFATKAALRRHFKRMPNSRQNDLLNALESQFAVGNCAVANPDLYSAMSWDEVRSLARAGMTIGSHTLNHQILSAVDPEQALHELRASREQIEREVGEECWCFGYPNGQLTDFRESDKDAVKTAGYACAFTQCPGSIDASSDRYSLPRIPIPDIGDVAIFRTHVSGLQRAIAALRGG
jgi:peptidoglycan/xylan/chitin deacetylase (PgdA/CDA1 family)